MISICDDLRKSVLQAAIQGRLTQQLPEDGDAEMLYQDIQKEKQKLIKEGKIKKEKSLSEITDDDIPFDIPESWKWVRLGNLGNFKKGPFGSSLTKSMFVPKSATSIKVYEQKNAIQKDWTLGDYYIRKEYFDSAMKGFEVFPGDIIVSCAGTIGETYVLPEGIEKGIINQALMRMMIFEPINQNYFLLFFDFMLKETARISSKGSAIKNIPPFDVFKNYLVPLPPLAEQKRIVACVDELMKRIDEMEKTEKDITALYDAFPGDMKASLLQAAIQGKLTEQLASDGDAETLYADIQKEKQRLIKEGKIKKEKPLPEITDDDIPFDIPENWKWVRLADVIEIRNGFTPSKTNPLFWKSKDIPWFTVSDKNKQGSFISSTEQYISNSAIGTSSDRIVPKDSVLLCCTASIGEYAYTLIDLTTNQQWNGLTPVFQS